MDDKNFREGRITYTVEFEKSDALSCIGDLKDWQGGYIAFSNKEFSLKNAELKSFVENHGEEIQKVIDKKAKDIPALKDTESGGYIMEIDLWRHEHDVYEEIAIEREDRGFLYQCWRLEPRQAENESVRCYWRKVNTSPRDNSIFKGESLRSVEVIWPEKRLHFFITMS